MFKTIRSKILVSYALLITIILFTISFSLSYLLEGYLSTARRNELIGHGQKIEQIALDIIKLNDQQALSALPLLERFLGVRIWIVDNEGSVIAASDSDRQSGFRRGRLVLEEMEQILSGNIVHQCSGTSYYDVNMFSTGIPLQDNDEVIGGVILHSSVSGLEYMMQQINNNLLWAAVLALIIAGFVSFILSRSISKPLGEMTETALKMAEGDFSKRVEVKNKDEVGKLAKSFNYLAKTLQETQRDLAQEKDQLAYTIESINEGVLAIDQQEKIILINPPASQFLRPELSLTEILGKEMMEIIPYKEVTALLRVVLQQGQKQSKLLALSHGGPYLMQASPVADQFGKKIGTVALISNWSQIDKIEEMQRDFTAGVSHELKTPLTIIRSYLQPLLDGTVSDQENIAKFLNTICQEAENLNRLIDELLDFSRLKSGRFTPRIEAFDLIDLIDEIKDSYLLLASKKNIKLTFDIPKELKMIKGDAVLIKRVVQNLLDNALAFTPQDGSVELLASIKSSKKILIEIKDTGIGIKEKELPFIWDNFYRGERSGTNAQRGWGLGLALVKAIINAHQQDLGVTSIWGQGSNFYFTLEQIS